METNLVKLHLTLVSGEWVSPPPFPPLIFFRVLHLASLSICLLPSLSGLSPLPYLVLRVPVPWCVWRLLLTCQQNFNWQFAAEQNGLLCAHLVPQPCPFLPYSSSSCSLSWHVVWPDWKGGRGARRQRQTDRGREAGWQLESFPCLDNFPERVFLSVSGFSPSPPLFVYPPSITSVACNMAQYVAMSDAWCLGAA